MLVIGVPMAAGIYALRTPVDVRFGVALLVLSVAWSLTALSVTSASVPYTIGRLTTFFVPLSVYYLLLVFPDERCARGFDRALRGAVWTCSGPRGGYASSASRSGSCSRCCGDGCCSPRCSRG